MAGHSLRGFGLPRIGGSSLVLGVAAVAIAAVALFFLPGLIGIGGAGSSPSPSLDPSASIGTSPSPESSVAGSPEPSIDAGPTPTVYVVQSGDTMSRIANKFHVPLGLLIEANRDAIPNPDRLTIGQEVVIPEVAPTTIPGASDAPSPSP